MEVGLQGLFSFTLFEYLKSRNIQFLKEQSPIFGNERFTFFLQSLELNNDIFMNIDWVGAEAHGGAVYFEVYEPIDAKKLKIKDETILQLINIAGRINQDIQIFLGKDWRTKQPYVFSRSIVGLPNLQEIAEEEGDINQALQMFYFENILECTTNFSAFSYLLNQTLPVLKNGVGKYKDIDWYTPEVYNFVAQDLVGFESRTNARRYNLYLEGQKEKREFEKKFENGERIFNWKTLEDYKSIASNLSFSDLQSQMDYELSKFSNTPDKKLAEQRLKILTDLINVKKES